MLTETILEAFNEQAQHEKTNEYIYRNFAGIADFQSLLGTTKWFMAQSSEEGKHFELVTTYIQDQGHIPKLMSIPEQEDTNITLYDMFVKTVAVEIGTTERLKKLCTLCKLESDDQSYKVALDLLYEQVEEVKMTTDILNRIKLAGTGLGFIVIDQELGER